MSFENMSAENRNLRRSQRMIRLNENIRSPLSSCLFCHDSGHNVSTCDDIRLSEFEIFCGAEAQNFIDEDDFKRWLMLHYSNDRNLLKSFAIRRCNSTIRTPLSDCIDNITNYIYRIYMYHDETEFEHDMIDFLGNLRTPTPNREPPPRFEDTEGIERMVMRELLYSTLLNMNINRELPIQRERDIERIFNIPSVIENNENVDIDAATECNICFNEKQLKNFVKFGCDHEFCKDCVKQTLINDRRETPCCPYCRSEISVFKLRTNDIHL
jgi:hypothetical protein